MDTMSYFEAQKLDWKLEIKFEVGVSIGVLNAWPRDAIGMYEAYYAYWSKHRYQRPISQPEFMDFVETHHPDKVTWPL